MQGGKGRFRGCLDRVGNGKQATDFAVDSGKDHRGPVPSQLVGRIRKVCRLDPFCFHQQAIAEQHPLPFNASGHPLAVRGIKIFDIR